MNISKVILIVIPLFGIYLLVSNNETFHKKVTKKPDVEIFESGLNISRTLADYTESSITNSRKNAITRAVAEVSPAVVGINVTSVERYISRSRDPFWDLFFPPRIYENQVKSLGSGFFMSSDGYLLTNAHVINNAEEIVITTTKGEKYKVDDFWTDKVTDIALLKIKGDGFPYIKMGNSDEIIVGEWVIALGNPFGLFDYNNQPAITVGVISAKDRDFSPSKDKSYQNMIQTDASINPGNSGGPLVNSLGEVIGMNAFIFSGRYNEGSIGLGFATPINKMKEIIQDLKKFGKIDRDVYTGIEFKDITRYISYSLGLKNNKGILVWSVRSNSPADKAGIKVGDIVIGVNGKDVDNSNSLKKRFIENDFRAGDIIEFKILRDNKIVDRTLKLAPLGK